MPGQSEALARVLEVGRLLSSTLDLGELLRAVLQLSARVVEAETASVLLLDEKTNELYFDVALGLEGQATGTRLKLGQGIAGSVALEQKPAVINDVRSDPRWSGSLDQKSGFSTRSILAVPMTVKGKLLGVLEAINKKDGAGFSFEDLRTFEAFASQAAVAIDNARLFTSLQEERVKLQTVFSETTDGVILTDLKGRIRLANAAAKRFLKRADAATIEEALEGLAMTPSLNEIARDPQAVRDFAAARETPTKLVLVGKINKLDDGWLCVFRDETEQWQRERLKRTFLSLISHKLKTPLAAITGFSDILLLELDRAEGVTPSLRKAANTISVQGAKLADLVDKLLRYTHLENPDTTTELEPCDLAALAADAVEEMAPWLSERQASVELEGQPGVLVFGNGEQLREVVKNLVENAAKFDAKPQKKVKVAVGAENGRAFLRVADTGRGIPPEDQDKVFSRFHQIEQFFTGQVDGWGLGLAYVKKVVESHGGQVALESRLGEGTTVTCRLPRRTTPA